MTRRSHTNGLPMRATAGYLAFLALLYDYEQFVVVVADGRIGPPEA